VAITSYNSLSTVATHEHVCSMLFSTYPESISGYEEPKELDRHTPATLRPTMPKNPGARTALPEAVNPGVLGPAPRTTKSRCRPLALSSGRGLPHPPQCCQCLVVHHQQLARPRWAHPVKGHRCSHPTHVLPVPPTPTASTPPISPAPTPPTPMPPGTPLLTTKSPGRPG
jgi:hypothetical protein